MAREANVGDGSKLMAYPGSGHRQGRKTFFSKNGGENYFYYKKCWLWEKYKADYYSFRKKGDEDIFSYIFPRNGEESFFSKNPVNLDWSLMEY